MSSTLISSSGFGAGSSTTAGPEDVFGVDGDGVGVDAAGALGV